jgi:hypothetical protein
MIQKLRQEGCSRKGRSASAFCQVHVQVEAMPQQAITAGSNVGYTSKMES